MVATEDRRVPRVFQPAQKETHHANHNNVLMRLRQPVCPQQSTLVRRRRAPSTTRQTGSSEFSTHPDKSNQRQRGHAS